MTLQLPKSLKVAERMTFSREDLEDQNSKRDLCRIRAIAAQNKRIMRQIRERREKPAENPGELLAIYCLSRAPRAAERSSESWIP